MNIFKLSVIIALVFGILGCTSMPWSGSMEAEETLSDVAVLTDYQLDNGFITIQAVGYGCTFFNSFKVEVANKNENALEVLRTQPDNCGMKPRNVSLQYSYKHLGLDLERDIKVKNPVDDSGLETLVDNR